MEYRSIEEKAKAYSREMFDFLRRMIATKSFYGEEGDCMELIKSEMEKLGYDKVQIDPIGNIIGTIGADTPERANLPVICYDGHMDTVGFGNPEDWNFDPLYGFEDESFIGGRGSTDMKGGLAAMIYAGKLIKELGYDEFFTLKVVGSVQEEDVEGRSWRVILKNDEILPRPEFVLLGEPTNHVINNGQKGRMELGIRVKGIGAHGSSPHLGENAIYKMAPIISAIERLNASLTDDGILGKGTVTISEIYSNAASRCAVADSCTIALDRRTNSREDLDFVLSQLRELPEVKAAGAEVFVFRNDTPSYRGEKFDIDLNFPSWILGKDSAAIKALSECYEGFYGKEPEITPLQASTNGAAIMGIYGIPTMIYGPGMISLAHKANEYTEKSQLVRALAMYTALPKVYFGK